MECALCLLLTEAGVVEEQQDAEAAESDRPCPGGWTKYKSRCFMFVNNAMTWPQAEVYHAYPLLLKVEVQLKSTRLFVLRLL